MSRAAHTSRTSAAVALRREIDAAVKDGAVLDDLVLRVTRNDVSSLKRDQTLALEDISFADGAMRYLGVRVEVGGVAESVLERRA